MTKLDRTPPSGSRLCPRCGFTPARLYSYAASATRRARELLYCSNCQHTYAPHPRSARPPKPAPKARPTRADRVRGFLAGDYAPQKLSLPFRAAVLERDGHKCQFPGCAQRADTVDHILSRSKGGTNHIENLRAACRTCNSRDGAWEWTSAASVPAEGLSRRAADLVLILDLLNAPVMIGNRTAARVLAGAGFGPAGGKDLTHACAWRRTRRDATTPPPIRGRYSEVDAEQPDEV